jgi:hypothetical protein
MSQQEPARVDERWLIYLILGILSIQVLLTVTMAVAGAIVAGSYAEKINNLNERFSEKLNSIDERVETLDAYWKIDSRNMFREIDKLKERHDARERASN